MNELPMPSDLKVARGTAPHTSDAGAPAASDAAKPAGVEPPSVKLIVRLFLIPLLIAAAVVGVMLPISRMAGSHSSVEEALDRLEQPGGERTADVLVGPGAQARYMAAQTVTQQMKGHMSEGERVELCRRLLDILDHHTKADEGNVQHFLLLALGRVWQIDPEQQRDEGAMTSPQGLASRKSAFDALLRYAGEGHPVATRKAATLALAYWAGRDEGRAALPALARALEQDKDLDVRMAAATALGPLAGPGDADAIEALNHALRDTDPHDAELVWCAAGSLAQLGQAACKDTVLMLLDRAELAGLKYFDRETDPKNPEFRPLNELEQQRILINTMLAARRLAVPDVQKQLVRIKDSDPSERVRAAAMEILEKPH